MYSARSQSETCEAVALDLEALDRDEGVDDLGTDRLADHLVGLERVECLVERGRQRLRPCSSAGRW